jgi:hypothetical protein
MSSSVSIRPRATSGFVSHLQYAPGHVLLLRLGRLIADVRQRWAERQVARAVEELDHPGVIADFQRARR